jgi:outer membrane protein assembly factor BamB
MRGREYSLHGMIVSLPFRVVAMRVRAVLLLVMLASLSPVVADDAAQDNREARGFEVGDWPVFLGPEHTGVSRETSLLESWPKAGPPLLWEKRIGTGYSAPAVLGDRLVVHHRQGNEEIVECWSATTGEPHWRYAYPTLYVDPFGYNNGPRCSPVLTADRCYTLGAEGMLACLNLVDGSRIWDINLGKHYEVPEHFFGFGCTPILEGDRLIVLVGGQPNSGVVAFSAASGDVLWEAVGRDTWNGVVDENGDPCEWNGTESIVSYSSPIAATIHGRRHVLCLMRHGLVSLDPATGRQNFKYWFRPVVHESVNAARPVVIGDTILLTAAYRQGAALIKVRADGNGYDIVWRNRSNLLAHWSTPIALNGYIYGFSGRHEQEGQLRCLRAEDGAVIWQTDGWEKSFAGLERDPTNGDIVDSASGEVLPYLYYGRGSKILAEGKFIVLGERGGTLTLVKATPEGWQETSRCRAPRIDYPAWAAPVLSRGRLYLRSEKWIVCLDLRRPQ